MSISITEKRVINAATNCATIFTTLKCEAGTDILCKNTKFESTLNP